MKINYKTYEIELIEDNSYSTISADNLRDYKFEYFGGEINKNRIYTINKRGLIIKEIGTGVEVSTAILCENGGRTKISQDIYCLEEDKLWICVGDKLYCLNIPALTVDWFNRIDYGTNYSITKFKTDFIVFGELGLVRMTKEGTIKWRFMGSGIFLSGKNNLKFFENHIELIDGNSEKYMINEFGEELSTKD